METVGTKRIIILAVLLGLNVLLAAAVYLWLLPQQDFLTTRANSLKGQATGLRDDAIRMTTQLDTIQKLKESYEQMQAAGFFASQDRVDARDRIRAIQKYSRVLTASYDIKPVVIDGQGDKLKAAEQVILSTPIDISVEALDDVDLYNFAALIKSGFPGYVAIDSIDVTRIHDLDESALRGIGSGAPTPLINGKISFTWNTVVDSKDVKVDDPTKAGN